ncbi:winged helix-turn-helix domain-containing protein [Thalassotalea fonticola]|uniref:Winged helix-turn-helix domain-containing protein n=1 Tax=Thalassotalea fonticola TaxID=3065649 RepID=A0ABZ0GN30_9GAMM|nr:winged helix-turn-helix domain-containing protein [Colwelliaceae bacterium S1-1]
MSGLKNKNFRLGEYLVQPEHNKLRLDDEEFKIEPKIMQVLCYLIEHKQEVVSRSQIAEDLWPNTVTGLEVVTRAIFELRKTLKDDPKKPIFIETVARKGYCFIYDVDDIVIAMDSKIFGQGFSKRHAKLAFLVSSVILTLVLIFLYTPKNNSVDMKPSILTDLSTYSDMPAISPDEEQLLFVRKKSFKDTYSQLVLLDFASQQQKVITVANAEYKSPVWLPDSEYWFYIRCEKPSSCEVVKHHINNHKTETIFSLEQQIFSFAISNDNNHLVLTLLKKNRMELALVDITSQDTQLNFLDAQTEYTFSNHPIFSHDDKSVYYISTIRGDDSQIYRYDLASQNSIQLSDNYGRIRGLALKDESSLWVSGNIQKTKGIWIFNLLDKQSNKAFETFPGGVPALLSSQLNADKLVYTNFSRTTNLSAAGIDDLKSLADINSSMIDMNAVYSTDMQALYFVSNRSGLYDIWRYKNNIAERMTNIKANMIERPILNLQQDKIAYLSRENSQTQMTLFDVIDKVELKRISLPNKAFLLSWSNDQKYIYFNRFEDGQYNVYTLNVDTSQTHQILLNAGGIVQESKDGKSLFYGDRLNRQLMQRMESGEIRLMFKIPENEKGLISHGLKVIDDGLYYASQQQNRYSLKYYSFAHKTLSEYMKLPDDVFVTDIVKGNSVGVIYDKFVIEHANLIELTN